MALLVHYRLYDSHGYTKFASIREALAAVAGKYRVGRVAQVSAYTNGDNPAFVEQVSYRKTRKTLSGVWQYLGTYRRLAS
jgi:hypothetical protein